MVSRNALFGPLDPAPDAGYAEPPARKGFFTDTSVCIGCKACEVACKEWNLIPEDGLNLLGSSYDNTGALSASTWRHVAFIEQPVSPGNASAAFAGTPTGGSSASPATAFLGMPGSGRSQGAGTAAEGGTAGGGTGGGCGGGCACGSDGGAGAGGGVGQGGGVAVVGDPDLSGADLSGIDLLSGSPQPVAKPGGSRDEMRWLMASDVCKHCTHAACLDVCPTGSLFRTEFGTVVVQEDICNGCGYCIPACPYGVIDQRKDDGRAWKCTLCYDRIGADLQPACAKACPTDSIQYGDVDELRVKAQERVDRLHAAGVHEARLYGNDPQDGVGGSGAFFLLLDEPEVYGLPPDPVVTTRDLPDMWRRAGMAALAMAGVAVASFLGGSA